MKRIVTAAIAALLIGLFMARGEDLSFTTRDGREFKNVTISGQDPSSIRVMTDAGIERLPLANLPEELQKRFGYDPNKATAYLSAQRSADLQRAADSSRAETAKRLAAKIEELSEYGSLKISQITGPNASDALCYGTIVKGEKSWSQRSEPIYVSGVGKDRVDGDLWKGLIYPMGRTQYTTVQGAVKTVRNYTADLDVFIDYLQRSEAQN